MRLPLVVLAVVLAGCAGPAAVTPNPVPTPALVTPSSFQPSAASATPSPARATAATSTLAGQFDIGGGRHMYISCQGQGSPTIILEAGGNDGAGTWPPSLMNALSARTRTCAYDRAGEGRSDQVPGPRGVKEIAADLDALLAAARIDGPFLLVGTSFGGLVSLYYALTHTDQTAGLVILDSDWPTTDPARDPTRSVLTKAQWAQILANDTWNSPDNREQVDFQGIAPGRGVSAEIQAVLHPLPGIPSRILTATQSDAGDCPPAWDCAEIFRRSIEFQKDWLTLSPTAVQILVGAGHVMHHEAPDLVSSEILKALDQVKP